ncbi:hypothetical protein TNCT_4661 [Trichonephila clavata]|uniref:Uncharacterized protein n=1 Tax=Trichonephila clavata TaxID=2740835 RepID=A0A8X6I889_TRICU|nr:hypothetical protein TNCT_4661 [Trichonephila clavata]
MKRIKNHKLAIVEQLKSYTDHEDGHFYQNTVEELRDIENSLTLAVSDFDSFPTGTTPGCPYHDLPPPPSKTPIFISKNSPAVSPSKSNLKSINSKRKDSNEFQLPRKTSKRSLFDQPSTFALQISPNRCSTLADNIPKKIQILARLSLTPLSSRRRRWPPAPPLQRARTRLKPRLHCLLL